MLEDACGWSYLGDRFSFGFRILVFGFALFATLQFQTQPSQAAFVHETDSEFFTSGDFNGDGLSDALVLDKRTGVARAGFQQTDGALTWSAAISTGVDSATALAVGRFSETNREAIAVTSSDLNRIHILDLSNPLNTPAIINPTHPGTTLLVGLDAPYGLPEARSWLDAGAHDAGFTLLDLFAFIGDSLASFQDQIAAEGSLSSGSSFRRSASDATLLAAMRRGSNDAFVAYAYTNTAAPVLVRSNLTSGTEYVFGSFNNEPYPTLLFYVPGQSNVIVQPLIHNGSNFEFGAATLNAFASAVLRVFYVVEETNGLALIQFGNGVAGLRPPAGGGGQLQVSYGFGVGPAGNVITGVTPLGTGKFALLSGASNSFSSLHAQVFTLAEGNYTETSSNTLPDVTTAANRGNVWLFQIEPFVSSAASVIGSLSAPAWSSTISGLPGSLSVRVESDGGSAAGLGSPGTNHFGAPPAGTVYVLPNQFRDDISFFSYAPVRAPESSVITISPPPGSYSGTVQISFSKQNAADAVYFRTSAAAAWQIHGSSFALTNDATVQYYGQTPAGERGRTQYADYVLGRTNAPGSDPVKLPGSDTNTPPGLNTNHLQLSANGTVFYSRHTALAELQDFQGPAPYLSFSNSPFSPAGFTYFHLENFEDGLFNTPGATPSAGWIVVGPGSVDSVDPNGRSYYSGGSQTNLTITFGAAALGGKLPTHAGVVWTDVGSVTAGSFGFGTVRFTARDAIGVIIGTNVGVNLGNGSPAPSQAEDRFFGVVSPVGISSISIAMPTSLDWEIDHVQYGFLDATGFTDSIWAINLDGTGETFITSGAKPRVSRDGQWMAFLREGGTVTSQGDLWVRQLSSGAESRYFTNTDSIVGFDWNGNSELIFDNECVLLRRAFDGPTTPLPIALTPECLNGAPVVNPFDGQLAFQNLNGSASGVYLTPPDLSSRTKLPEPGTLRLRWPGWSFDGSRLVLADRISTSFIRTGVNLWTASADGSNLHQITGLTEPAGGFPYGAIWTPDGRALVGAGRINGTNGLWLLTLSPDGFACVGAPRLLPTSIGSDIDFAGSIIVAPPPPTGVMTGLFIRQEPNAVVVYWSPDFEGYTLESQDELSDSDAWTAIPGPYATFGGYYEHREFKSVFTDGKFFRLHLTTSPVLRSAHPGIWFRLGASEIVLSWPSGYSNYSLEVTTNLSPPVKWRPVNGTFQGTNGMIEYRRSRLDSQQEFYRLRGP